MRGQRFKSACYLDQNPAYEFLHALKDDPDDLINLATNPEYAAQLKLIRRRTDALAEGYVNALD